MLALLFICFFANSSLAQVSGTITVPGNYATLGAALFNIQVSGLSGHVIIELQQGYDYRDELYPLVVPENFPTSLNATVTIRPRIGAIDIHIGTGYLGTGPANTGSVPIFKIYGSNIIIDGRPGGGGTISQLFIWSEDEAGSAIEFANNSSDNIIRYCSLLGSNKYSSTNGFHGIITFSTDGPFPAGVEGGNRNNLIENCTFNKGLSKPDFAIYSYGSANAPNVGNRILNNNIASFGTSGMRIEEWNNSGSSWTITGNSIYSSDLNYNYPQGSGIDLSVYGVSGTHTIEGNYVGGNAPFAAGKWNGGIERAIQVYLDQGGTYTSVNNNVIKNMEIIDGGFGTTFLPINYGINITNNGPNVVECNGNLIGAENSSEHGISIGSSVGVGQSYFNGINYHNCDSGSVSDNIIQYISLNSQNTSLFEGIRVDLDHNPVIVTNNTIQFLDILSNGYVQVFGIIDPKDDVVPCGSSLQAPAIGGNSFKNVSVISETGDATVTGVHINGRLATNDGNIIGSLTEANSISVTAKNAIVNGILIEENPDNVSVSNDVVANITASGTVSSEINGVHFKAAGNTTISGNTIRNLNAGTARGIFVEPITGLSQATLQNNSVKGINVNTGTGVEVNVPTTATLTLVAKDNVINTWQTGFLVTAAAGSTLTQTVQSNAISGNQTGFVNNSTSPQNATCNWWGSASGPSGAGPGTGDPVGSNVIFSPWATVSTFVAVDAGADQTIYIGYGPTSKTIAPIYTVCGTPTYLWSTGATTPNITVSPTVTSTYSVTVTDANNHSATDNVTIVVNDIRCGNNKVKICHKDIGGKKKTICINTNDVASHLTHGDALGECSTNAARFANAADEINSSNEKTFSLYPNPVAGDIKLQWQANTNGTAFIQIKDMMGRLLMQQNITQTKGANNRLLSLKGVQDGNYILVMQTGDELKVQRFTVRH